MSWKDEKTEEQRIANRLRCAERYKRKRAEALAWQKAYRLEHREEILAKKRGYYQREDVKAKRREKYATDPEFAESVRKRAAKWYRENPEQGRATRRDYAAEHAQEARDRSSKWRAANPEKDREMHQKWRKANDDTLRVKKKTYYDDIYRPRAKEVQLKRLYGLTIAEFNSMLESQGYRSEICGCELRRGPDMPGRTPHVDHDHKTNKVRAILCSKSNTLLGLANEDEQILLAAINYLRKHRGEPPVRLEVCATEATPS